MASSPTKPPETKRRKVTNVLQNDDNGDSTDATTISQVFVGTVVHSVKSSELTILKPGILGVSNEGKIVFVEKVIATKTDAESIYQAVEAALEGLVDTYRFHADVVCVAMFVLSQCYPYQ
jgi:hypothetical protein